MTTTMTVLPQALIHQVLTKEIPPALHLTLVIITLVYFTGVHCPVSGHCQCSDHNGHSLLCLVTLIRLINEETLNYFLFITLLHLPFVFSFPGASEEASTDSAL